MLSRKDCELLVLIEAFLFECCGAVCGGVGGVFAMSSSHYNQSTRRIEYDGGSTPPVFYHDSTLHVITTKRDSGSILSSMCRTIRSVRTVYVYYSIIYIFVWFVCATYAMYVMYVPFYLIWFDGFDSFWFDSILYYLPFDSFSFPAILITILIVRCFLPGICSILGSRYDRLSYQGWCCGMIVGSNCSIRGRR